MELHLEPLGDGTDEGHERPTRVDKITLILFMITWLLALLISGCTLDGGVFTPDDYTKGEVKCEENGGLGSIVTHSPVATFMDIHCNNGAIFQGIQRGEI